MERVFLVAAGLIGLCGLILKAAAFHQSGPGGVSLAIGADIALLHGAALMALAGVGAHLAAPARASAAIAFIVGVMLFAGPMALARYAGMSDLSPLTPFGGGLLMLGWLAVLIGAIAKR